MPNFHYQALDADGQLAAGDLEADGVQQAVAQLLARGLIVQSIGLAPTGRPSPRADAAAPEIQTAAHAAIAPERSASESVEQAVLRSHMATILERGRAIAPALRAYAEEMPAGWQRRQLLALCGVVVRSDPAEATAALAELPECWIPLLSAATSSPDPDQVLREFLTESRRTDDLRHKWWLTLAYPIILACLTTVVMTALSIFVIPEFRAIFSEFGLELPTFSIWLLSIANFLSSWGMLIIVALLALFAIVLLNANRLLPSPTFVWLSDRFHPPFGRRTAVARFAHFTADLLDAGVSVPDALRIAGFTVNQSRMQQAAWRLANDIESIGEFSLCDYQRPLTASVAYALTPDVPPASRVRLLREISSCHADRVRIGLSWSSGIIEPIAVCVVGFAVGSTVLALFLPLVNLVKGLSN